VYVHWGVEGATCPTPLQKTLARQLVDAGADVVVGSHSHRVEGAGRLGNGFVAYGLGNFVFYNEAGESGVSGVLELTVAARRVERAQWVPAAIRSGVPTPLTGSAADAGIALLEHAPLVHGSRLVTLTQWRTAPVLRDGGR
jgi:poly-gamma-glutamate synthesis protein (capsule biosynthesis protein)